MANRKKGNKVFLGKCDNLLDKHRPYIISIHINVTSMSIVLLYLISINIKLLDYTNV